MDDQLFWTIVAAVGQVAGAVATFAAVVVSLYLATSARKPRVKLRVGERLIIGGGVDDQRVLMFSVANVGERNVHVRTLGWRTGRLRWGPQWLKRQAAVQLTGGVIGGTDPPYELLPGAEISSHAEMGNILTYCRERDDRPFFTRDIPWLGRRRTAVRAFISTADGYVIHVRPERALLDALVQSEKDALTAPPAEE
ncbi:MAG: hypothetical protein U0975_07185 [Erythrobacter sp.]|nr:hypothetical protein [Erythrobacter sp.]MDZ4272441.1 hypothetical protein [Erythrobacter sp.]